MPVQHSAKLIGHLRWVTGRQVFVEADFDRIAWDDRHRLMLLSCVCPAMQIKALRGGLNTEFEAPFSIDGCERADLYADEDKYDTKAIRIGPDLLHAIFVCRVAGLLLDNQDATLWADLKHERFRTPLLPAWMPHIRRQLELSGSLTECESHGCMVWRLSTTTAELDRIVTEGVKGGQLKIEACASGTPDAAQHEVGSSLAVTV
jgi:hypothetical protein